MLTNALTLLYQKLMRSLTFNIYNNVKYLSSKCILSIKIVRGCTVLLIYKKCKKKRIQNKYELKSRNKT